jgi:uncharacterized protein YndB with AHSA1/START domain
MGASDDVGIRRVMPGAPVMVKKIVIGGVLVCVVVVAGFCVVVGLQPNTFSVERSATIAAPPERVFVQVNDLAAWDAWSPWSKLDPNAKTTLSTPSAGKGATFAWVGNQEVGEGSLTILESKPDELVDVEQEFVKPLPGKARMVFTLVPQEGGTGVNWKMSGNHGFLEKAVCLFMDMDAMLGKDFERGLANMKEVVEKGAAAPAETTHSGGGT